MKKLLRSFVVLTVVLASATTATLGYFTSNVSATGNLITTGTLRLALDSTQPGSGNAGYVVAYDNNGVVTQLSNFPTITNIAPGETRSVYVAVRNIATLPFDYRANITGTWANGTLDGSAPNSGYLTAAVRRLNPTDCAADVECLDIQGWLNSFSHTQDGAGEASSTAVGDAHSTAFFGHPSAISDGSYTLDPGPFLSGGYRGEYSVFKVDFSLDNAAGNDFQGQTFTWALNAQAKQTAAPGF